MNFGDNEIYFHRDNVTENRGRHTLKKHYHDLFEIYFIEGGGCCYFIDNKSYNLIPGDIIFVPAGVVHNTEYKTIIYVTGHTDSTGSDAYNNTLSQNRASAVANYLSLRGVNASRMVVRGMGKTSPIASNDTAEGRAQNRRVELSIQQIN